MHAEMYFSSLFGSQGSKYQRRWFELTTDTLAYAKDAKELKDGGGDIEVFAIHELKYIKKLEDDKLEVHCLQLAGAAAEMGCCPASMHHGRDQGCAWGEGLPRCCGCTQMKFPERMLRVKAESGGDQDRWFNAIKSAQQAKVEGATAPQSKQLDTFKMVGFASCGFRGTHTSASKRLGCTWPSLSPPCRFASPGRFLHVHAGACQAGVQQF